MAKYLRPTGAYMPTGSVVTWLTATAPEGWLICNGDAISRITYADLFSVIGTTFGVGDGSTTFNLPDTRGMFLRGAGTNGTYTNSAGTGYAGPSVAAQQDDAMQRITGSYEIRQTPFAAQSAFSGSFSDGGATANGTTDFGTGAAGVTRQTNFDSSNSTSPNASRTDDAETRPANIGVNYIIKV
jgi:microcystin-dependent protein